jgi:hypothetical protein
LTFDYCKEEVSQLLGHDEYLIACLQNIRTEMLWLRKWTFKTVASNKIEWHTEAGKHLLPEDNLFKLLILDNENRLIESHKKAARRRGLL